MTDPERSDGLRSIRVTGSPPSLSTPTTGRETPVTVPDKPVTVGIDSTVAAPAAMTAVEPVALLRSPVAVLGGAAVDTRSPGRSALVYRHPAELRDGDDSDGTTPHRLEGDSTGLPTADERATQQLPPGRPAGQPRSTGDSRAVSGDDPPEAPVGDLRAGSTGGGDMPVAGHRPLSLNRSTADARPDPADAHRQHDTERAGPLPGPTPALRYRLQTTGTDAGSSPDRTAGDPETDSALDTTAAGSDTGTARLPGARTGDAPDTDAGGSTETSTGPGDIDTRRDRHSITGRRAQDPAGGARRQQAGAVPPGGRERAGRTRVERLVERRHAGNGFDAHDSHRSGDTVVNSLTRLSTTLPGGGAGETGSVTADPPVLISPTTAAPVGARGQDAVGRDGPIPPAGAGLTHLSPARVAARQEQSRSVTTEHTVTGEPPPGIPNRSPPQDSGAVGPEGGATSSQVDTGDDGPGGAPRTDAVRGVRDRPGGPDRGTALPAFTHLSTRAPSTGNTGEPRAATDRPRGTPPPTPDTTAGTDRTTGLPGTKTPGETALPDRRRGITLSRADAGRGRDRPALTHLFPGERDPNGGKRGRRLPTDREQPVDGGRSVVPVTTAVGSEEHRTGTRVADTDTVLSRVTGTSDRRRPALTNLSPGVPAGDSQTPVGPVDGEQTGDRRDDPGATGAVPVSPVRVDTTTASRDGSPPSDDRSARSTPGGAGGMSHRPQAVEADRDRPLFTRLSTAGGRVTELSPGGVPAAGGPGGSTEHGTAGSGSGDGDREQRRQPPEFTHLSPPGGEASGRPGTGSLVARRGRGPTGSSAATSADRRPPVGTPPPGLVELAPRAAAPPDASNRTTAGGGHGGVGTGMTVLSGDAGTGKDLSNEGTHNSATHGENMPSLTLHSTGGQRSNRSAGSKRPAAGADSTERPAEAPERGRQGAGTGGARTDHARRVERSLDPGSGQTEHGERRNRGDRDSAVGADLTVKTLAPRIDATRREHGPRDITHTDRGSTRQSPEPPDTESLFRAASTGGERPPADIDQVVERLYRRIERKMRIERERRGL